MCQHRTIITNREFRIVILCHVMCVHLDGIPIGLPDGITCGQVSDGQTSGTYTSPGYPNYQHNLDCAYVIKVPQGYTIQLIIHNFNVETRYAKTMNIDVHRHNAFVDD